MNVEQLSGLACGLAALAVGLKAILTREVAITPEDEDEPDLWLYGWRAVAVGCGWILLACLCFAVAAGVVPLSSGWSSQGG